MKKIYNFIFENLGKLYRDIIVLGSGDYVEYISKGGCFIYKNILPFNMILGTYKFVKKKDFEDIISRL